MEKIKENWAAIEAAERKAREKTGDPEAGFGANCFWPNGKGLYIACKYRSKKGKKGQQVFTQSYKDLLVEVR